MIKKCSPTNNSSRPNINSRGSKNMLILAKTNWYLMYNKINLLYINYLTKRLK